MIWDIASEAGRVGQLLSSARLSWQETQSLRPSGLLMWFHLHASASCQCRTWAGAASELGLGNPGPGVASEVNRGHEVHRRAMCTSALSVLQLLTSATCHQCHVDPVGAPSDVPHMAPWLCTAAGATTRRTGRTRAWCRHSGPTPPGPSPSPASSPRARTPCSSRGGSGSTLRPRTPRTRRGPQKGGGTLGGGRPRSFGAPRRCALAPRLAGMATEVCPSRSTIAAVIGAGAASPPLGMPAGRTGNTAVCDERYLQIFTRFPRGKKQHSLECSFEGTWKQPGCAVRRKRMVDGCSHQLSCHSVLWPCVCRRDC